MLKLNCIQGIHVGPGPRLCPVGRIKPSGLRGQCAIDINALPANVRFCRTCEPIATPLVPAVVAAVGVLAAPAVPAFVPAPWQTVDFAGGHLASRAAWEAFMTAHAMRLYTHTIDVPPGMGPPPNLVCFSGAGTDGCEHWGKPVAE